MKYPFRKGLMFQCVFSLSIILTEIKQEPSTFSMMTSRAPTKSVLDAKPFSVTVEKVNIAPHLTAKDNRVLVRKYSMCGIPQGQSQVLLF